MTPNVGFAQMWCENVREANARGLARTDPQSSGECELFPTESGIKSPQLLQLAVGFVFPQELLAAVAGRSLAAGED